MVKTEKTQDIMKKLKWKYEVIGGLGAVFLCIGLFLQNYEQHNYFTGLGAMFLVLALLRLIQHRRYLRNEAYAEKVEVMYQDERNLYLSQKASHWTFTFYNIGAALLVIVLEALGRVELAQIIAYTVILQMLLYLVCYQIVKKKY